LSIVDTGAVHVTPEILIADKETLAAGLIADFDTHGRLALTLRGVFTVALSGGSLASEFFPALARLPFDWARTEFFWADERAVPPSDPESNFGVAQSLWLGPANVPAANIHRMRGERIDLQRAAREYTEALTTVAGTPPRLDLVLLGLGPDGHIASLFPGHPVSLEEQQLVAVVENSPKPPPRRLTLTMPVLAGAARVTVVALGKEKAAAIRDALERNAATPVGILVKRARDIRFLLDQEAAGLLVNKVE
jgi:6-phosphogluconolactonase